MPRRAIIYDYSALIIIVSKSERYGNGFIEITEEDENEYDALILKLEEWQKKLEGMRTRRKE